MLFALPVRFPFAKTCPERSRMDHSIASLTGRRGDSLGALPPLPLVNGKPEDISSHFEPPSESNGNRKILQDAIKLLTLALAQGMRLMRLEI